MTLWAYKTVVLQFPTGHRHCLLVMEHWEEPGCGWHEVGRDGRLKGPFIPLTTDLQLRSV